MTSPTQTDLAFRGLRKAILQCSLAPGARLRVNEVCEDYEVSLGAAREALSRLMAEGMVAQENRRGYRVAPISMKEFRDNMEARAEIEAACLDRSVKAGDVEWESRVTAAFYRLSRLERHDDEGAVSEDWQSAHVEFHTSLVAACGNQVLLDLRQTLFTRFERYRYWALSVSLKYGRRAVQAEHEALAKAALKRDAAEVSRLIHAHFGQTTVDFLKAAEAAGAMAYPPDYV